MKVLWAKIWTWLKAKLYWVVFLSGVLSFVVLFVLLEIKKVNQIGVDPVPRAQCRDFTQVIPNNNKQHFCDPNQRLRIGGLVYDRETLEPTHTRIICECTKD